MLNLLKLSLPLVLPLIVAVGIPTFVVALGILSNKQDTTRISSEIRDLRNDFNVAQKQHHDDIMRLHGGILILVQRDTDTQKSIARLEAKSQS